MDRSNFTTGLGQHHNITVARPGSPCPNPTTHPFDTDADSDPELASPLTFSDDLKVGPETYTYTAKRYTFTYTRMRRVRVRVRVRAVANPSDHCLNRGRGRNRNRNRSPSCMALGLPGPLQLHRRVGSAP
ncbi:MAG: hypothetical protein ACOX52_22725 [Verrucomicrobiota bacterium]